MNRVFSKDFVQGWKKALIDTYGYEEYMDFVVQPSFGKKYLSYLPFINYTDRKSDEIEDLLELAKDNHFQIRALNFAYQDFKDHDPVTLRLHVANKSEDDLMKQNYKTLARRNIRKVQRNPKIRCELTEDVRPFYTVLRELFKDHGTPVYPLELFENFKKHFGDAFQSYVLYHDNEIIGSKIAFIDNGLALLYAGGIPNRFKKLNASYFLDHYMTMHLQEKFSIEIIDFGRSPYNGGTFFYKTRFGAEPIKIDILTDNPKDIYNAYSIASTIWKKLPNAVTNFVGPKLTKYLVDL